MPNWTGWSRSPRRDPVCARVRNAIPGRWRWRCCWVRWRGCGRSVADDRVGVESSRLERAAFPAPGMAVGPAGAAGDPRAGAVPAAAQRCMAAGSGSPPAAAPAGGRHASPYAPALGAAAGLDAGVAGDGRAELAAAGAADISGQRTAAGRAGSVQPDHRHRPAAVAAAAGAGQAGRAAARAQRRPGRPGGVCG
ncbi:hypothetical protein G6F35_006841 [Rhizopus arrhizus]|nr:hypothetical protein G6F35_006841 [Rhizopus arrhizus]